MKTAAPSAFASGVNRHVPVMVGQNTDELITFYKSSENNLWTGYVNPEGSPPGNPFPANLDASQPYFSFLYNIADQALITAFQKTTVTSTFGEIYAQTMAAAAGFGWFDNVTAGEPGPVGYEELYGDISDPVTKLVQASTDSYLSATTSSIVDTLTSDTSRTAGVYRYLFAQGQPDWFAERQPGWGACHGCELTYVLGMYVSGLSYPMASTYGQSVSAVLNFSVPEMTLGQTMKGYWVSFFETGNPNGGGLPYWNPASRGDQNVMVFNEAYSMGAALNPCLRMTECIAEPAYNYKAAESAFWKGETAVAKGTCTTVPPEAVSLKVISANQNCPAYCPATCPSARKLLFGAATQPPLETPNPGCCP